MGQEVSKGGVDVGYLGLGFVVGGPGELGGGLALALGLFGVVF